MLNQAVTDILREIGEKQRAGVVVAELDVLFPLHCRFKGIRRYDVLIINTCARHLQPGDFRVILGPIDLPEQIQERNFLHLACLASDGTEQRECVTVDALKMLFGLDVV